jgi:hypothetical protein
MSVKKTAVKKAAKAPVALQPVKTGPAKTATPQAAATPAPKTAKLLNHATGQVVTVARKVAESLSFKYPQQYQTLN